MTNKTDYVAALDNLDAANTAFNNSLQALNTLQSTRAGYVTELNALIAAGSNTDAKRSQISTVEAQITNAINDLNLKESAVAQANGAYSLRMAPLAREYLAAALDAIPAASLDKLVEVAKLIRVNSGSNDEFIKVFGEQVCIKAVKRGNAQASFIPTAGDSLAFLTTLARA